MWPAIVKLVNSPHTSAWLVNCGGFPIEALQTTKNSPVAGTHRVEIHGHSLSDVRAHQNNTAEHTAEIVVASHRAAEIE
jgi:hypothetical protein